MNKVEIFEQDLTNRDGVKVGKIAILITNHYNPVDTLDKAVTKYVGDEYHNQFVDITFDHSMRVVTQGLGELDFMSMEAYKRINKINSILGDEEI